MHAPLTEGSTLGPYRILDHLGSGGMGEVYRAQDPKLERVVAIKVLHPALVHDQKAMARFRREAKAVASLSHPNILDIHDLGEDGGRIYAVMELLEGQTFRQIIQEGPSPLRKVRTWGIQVAEGLAAAHAKGLIHRDIKPENLFLTRDGRVKILDFGLVKTLLEPEDSSGENLTGPVPPPAVTQEGVVLGTVGYMSPEQVRGQKADTRCDLFSLGVVLVELLTGRHPFRRDSTADTLSSILKDDPFDSVSPGELLTPALERFFRRCLEKQAEDRFQHAKDLGFALEALPERTTGTFLPLRSRRRIWSWMKGAAAILLLVGLGAVGARMASPARDPGQPTFQRLTFQQGNLLNARFRSGTVVYSAAWNNQPAELFTVRPDGTEDRPLRVPNAEVLASSPRGELALRISPYAISAPESSGTLALLTPDSGPTRPLLEGVLAADYGPKGLAATQWQFSSKTAKASYVLRYPLEKVLYTSPHFLSAVRVSPKGDALAVFEYDPTRKLGRILRLDMSGHIQVLVENISWTLPGMAWTPDGRELWYSLPPEEQPHFELWAVDAQGRRRMIRTDSTFYALHDIDPEGRCLIERSTSRSRLIVATQGGERDLSCWDQSSLGGISQDGQSVLFTESGEGARHQELVFYRSAHDQPAIRLGEGKAYALSPDRQWAAAWRKDRPGRLFLLPTGTGLPREWPVDLQSMDGCRFLPDNRHLMLSGVTATGASRVLLLDGETGATLRTLPSKGLTAQDGSGFLVLKDGNLVEMDLEGQFHRTFPAKLPSLCNAVAWSGDKRELFVWNTKGLPHTLSALNLETGTLRTLRALPGRHTPGFLSVDRVLTSRDGETVAYSLRETVMSDLLIVTFPKQ